MFFRQRNSERIEKSDISGLINSVGKCEAVHIKLHILVGLTRRNFVRCDPLRRKWSLRRAGKDKCQIIGFHGDALIVGSLSGRKRSDNITGLESARSALNQQRRCARESAHQYIIASGKIHQQRLVDSCQLSRPGGFPFFQTHVIRQSFGKCYTLQRKRLISGFHGKRCNVSPDRDC